MNKFNYDIGNHSEDFGLEGQKVTLKGKTYTWVISDCKKHLKLTRSQSPSCNLCTQNGHIAFLEGNGVEIVDRVSSNNYLVKLQCGHDKIVKPDQFNFSKYCKQCRDSDVLNRCPEGTEIKGYFAKGQKVELKLPCGHFTTRKTYTEDNIQCMDCKNENKDSTLNSIGAYRNSDGTYALSCGHSTGLVDWQRLVDYKCLACERKLIQSRGEQAGMTPTGNYDSEKKTHEFLLSCGHTKHIKASDIKQGTVCSICAEDHLSKPSDMYLLVGASDDLFFLKVGVANDTISRIKAYKQKQRISWIVFASVGFQTKRDALKVEKAFHKENSSRRIDPETMRKYISEGFTECYPMKMFDEIKSRMYELMSEYGGSVHFRTINPKDYE